VEYFTTRAPVKQRCNLTSLHWLDVPVFRTADNGSSPLEPTYDREGPPAVPNAVQYSRALRQSPAHSSGTIPGGTLRPWRTCWTRQTQDIPGVASFESLLLSVRSRQSKMCYCSGTHPSSCPLATVDRVSLGVKVPGA
jgi:hypothetical protein